VAEGLDGTKVEEPGCMELECKGHEWRELEWCTEFGCRGPGCTSAVVMGCKMAEERGGKKAETMDCRRVEAQHHTMVGGCTMVEERDCSCCCYSYSVRRKNSSGVHQSCLVDCTDCCHCRGTNSWVASCTGCCHTVAEELDYMKAAEPGCMELGWCKVPG